MFAALVFSVAMILTGIIGDRPAILAGLAVADILLCLPAMQFCLTTVQL
jgi:hypothetical protein